MTRARRIGAVCLTFAVTRLIAFGATHLGARHMTPEKAEQWKWVPNSDLLHPGPPPPPLLEPLIRWDSNFYISLAVDGYPPRHPGPNHHLAFFPLYGLAVRGAMQLVPNPFWAAFLVSNLSTLIAAFLMLELGGLEVVILFLSSPGAHFLLYPYTEALFTALLAATLLLVRSKRYLLAALPAAAASATRSPGIAGAVALLTESVANRGSDRLRALAASAVALGGLGAFMAWCYFAQGDALAFVHMQGLHNRHLSVLGPVRAFIAFDTDPDYYLVTIACIAAFIGMIRRTPAWQWVTAGFILFLPLATGTLQAMIRYQAANVPLICAVPQMSSRRVYRAMIVACLALMAFEAYLFGKGIGHY